MYFKIVLIVQLPFDIAMIGQMLCMMVSWQESQIKGGIAWLLSQSDRNLHTPGQHYRLSHIVTEGTGWCSLPETRYGRKNMMEFHHFVPLKSNCQLLQELPNNYSEEEYQRQRAPYMPAWFRIVDWVFFLQYIYIHLYIYAKLILKNFLHT